MPGVVPAKAVEVAGFLSAQLPAVVALPRSRARGQAPRGAVCAERVAAARGERAGTTAVKDASGEGHTVSA